MTDRLSFEQAVDLLQRTSGDFSKAERAALVMFTLDESLMRKLFYAVSRGLEIPAKHLSLLTEKLYSQQVNVRFWFDQKWFDDDANFTNTRLGLISRCWSGAYPGSMLRQLTRMFVHGRVDITYLDNLWFNAQNSRQVAASALVIAHSVHTRTISPTDIEAFNTSLPLVGVLSQHDAATQKYLAETADRATAMRNAAFMKYWLPTAISESEYRAARVVPPVLLADLYPHIWLDGYTGYQARLGSA